MVEWVGLDSRTDEKEITGGMKERGDRTGDSRNEKKGKKTGKEEKEKKRGVGRNGGDRTGAGENEVADACKAAHGERVGAKLDGQPRHLRQAPRYERRAPVVPKAQPIRNSAADGQHVLQRAPQLHSCEPTASISKSPQSCTPESQRLLSQTPPKAALRVLVRAPPILRL